MSARRHRHNAVDKTNEWLYDHPKTRTALDWSFTFIVCTISALIFAFGFATFISPAINDIPGGRLISGGLSGISQVITIFLQILGWRNINISTAYSVMYFLFNIPLIVLAFFGISKRFSLFTLINVAEVSLFTKLLTADKIGWIYQLSTFVAENGGLLARALFAGMMTGVSSAICFKVDISAGGIDVISYYIALKKGNSVGRYSILLNGANLLVYIILSTIKAIQYERLGLPLDGVQSGMVAILTVSETIASGESTYAVVPIVTSASALTDATALSAHQFGMALHSVIYLFTATLVIDRINVRNKKLKIEIITSKPDLADVLISSFPHGATLIKGTGVYTGQERYMINMVVSSYEVKRLTAVVKNEDPESFIEVTELASVLGRFFMKPVK